MSLATTRLTHLAGDERFAVQTGFDAHESYAAGTSNSFRLVAGHVTAACYMDFRHLNMATSAAPRANHSPVAHR